MFPDPFFIHVACYALLVLMLVTTVFVVAQLRSDNSIMDIAYGPIFAISGWVTLFLLDSGSPLAYLVLGLCTVWAIRLSARIGRKNWGEPEDSRYAAWREKWRRRGEVYFILRSYLQVFLLQGVIITIVALPLIIALATEAATVPLLTYLAATVMLLGLSIETLADYQLDGFLRRRRAGESDEPFFTGGLFRYSRRPNYFGEALVWWGFALMVLPFPNGAMALWSPLLIIYIMTRVTGPMLEEQFINRYGAAYHSYRARTSFFIPWPPQTVTATETAGQ